MSIPEPFLLNPKSPAFPISKPCLPYPKTLSSQSQTPALIHNTLPSKTVHSVPLLSIPETLPSGCSSCPDAYICPTVAPHSTLAHYKNKPNRHPIDIATCTAVLYRTVCDLISVLPLMYPNAITVPAQAVTPITAHRHGFAPPKKGSQKAPIGLHMPPTGNHGLRGKRRKTLPVHKRPHTVEKGPPRHGSTVSSSAPTQYYCLSTAERRGAYTQRQHSCLGFRRVCQPLAANTFHQA